MININKISNINEVSFDNLLSKIEKIVLIFMIPLVLVFFFNVVNSMAQQPLTNKNRVFARLEINGSNDIRYIYNKALDHNQFENEAIENTSRSQKIKNDLFNNMSSNKYSELKIIDNTDNDSEFIVNELNRRKNLNLEISVENIDLLKLLPKMFNEDSSTSGLVVAPFGGYISKKF